MKNFFGILLAFFCLSFGAEAATVISATLSLTNSVALTNATSGQKYTLNSDARTFTNSLASPSTQIRVGTNDSAATILLSLVAQAGAYPFTDVTSLTTSGGTNVTFRAASGTALTITLSPTNWGRVTYSTQTVGTVSTIVQVPFSVMASTNQTIVGSQLWSDLDAHSTNRGLGAVDFSGAVTHAAKADFAGRVALNAGLGLHGRGLVGTNYTLTTNDLYLGADTRSNTNLILTLPSAASASNLLFLIKDEGGAGATNGVKIYPGSGDRIDGLTNLTIAANYGSATLRSRGGTNYALLSTGGGVSGSVSGGGSGTGATEIGFVTLTNGDATVTTTNVSTNTYIFLTRYSSDGSVFSVNEASPRQLYTSFHLLSSDGGDNGTVMWQLLNTGASSPVSLSGYYGPLAYFRLDDTDSNTNYFVDVIGGNNFTNTGGLGDAHSTNGIIANAYAALSPGGAEFRAGNSPYDFGTNDFAIRFWVRPRDVFDANFLFFDSFTDGWNGYLRNAGGTNRVRWEADVGGAYTDLDSTNNLALNSWHRVVLWHKQGVELGLKADNHTSETLSFTNLTSSTAALPYWYINDSSSVNEFDEISVWKGYVPTEAELLYDWNSGAGRAYPLR